LNVPVAKAVLEFCRPRAAVFVNRRGFRTKEFSGFSTHDPKWNSTPKKWRRKFFPVKKT
jgi:hypothetical protein